MLGVLASMLSTIPPVQGASDTAELQFESVSRLLEKADKQREEGNSEEAGRLYGATIAAYNEFRSNYPDLWIELIQFRIAYCRNQLMNLLAAKHTAEKSEPMDTPPDSAKEMLSPDAAALLAKSIELCRKGDFAQAASNASSVVKTHTNCTEAILILATSSVGIGKIDEAISHLKRAIEIDPSNKESHYNLSQLLIRQNEPDFETARLHYNEAIKLGAKRDADLEIVLGLE